MSSFYGLIIEPSRDEKPQNTESFCLSILTTYTSDSSTKVLTCLLLPCIFFSTRFLNMCEAIICSFIGWPTGIGILWKWTSTLKKVACDGECRLAWLHVIRNFLLNEIYDFLKLFLGLHLYLDSLLKIISSLFSHFCLFQNAILHKILKLRFLKL